MHEMIKRSGVAAMAIAMALSSVCFNMLPAAAASQSNPSNPANIIQDIGDADIIDTDRTGSIHIYKYDTTSAEASGDYHEGDIKATGQEDTNVSDALSDYAIKGVEFTYLKVGDIETFSNTKAAGDNPGSDIVVVYEIPDELQEILNDEANGHEYLKAEDAYDMSSTGENRDTLSKTCDKRGVKHYTSTQIDDALQQILEDDNIKAKNALEGYLVTYGSQDKTGRQDSDEKQNFSTDSGVLTTASDGTASVDGLPLGLYLIVETKVPEMVTSTVNPWFVTLPFTNTSIQTEEKNGHSSASSTTHTDNGMDSDDNNGGDYWLYDFHAYPKNQTGNPTLDKSVRNSYSVESVTGGKTGRKNNGVDIADTYVSSLAGKTAANAALINDTPDNVTAHTVVYNSGDVANHELDTTKEKYIQNRGGYTNGSFNQADSEPAYSRDYEYRDVTTASEGDVLDYIVVSKMPTITSRSTYLSEYTFIDQLGPGITYNKNDIRIAFYADKANAVVNNTSAADLIWEFEDGKFTGKHGGEAGEVYATGSMVTNSNGSAMTITMTEQGLNFINNEGSSDTAYALPSQAGVTKGLSGYYMVLYYTATVESNDQVTLGDNGNLNDVALIWARTSPYDENPNNPGDDNYFNKLEDRNYVYSYGIDLTKTFAKSADATAANYAKVEFKLYNETDAYYVIAEPSGSNDGVYYVTGKTANDTNGSSKDGNYGKDEATTFIPDANGRLYIKGLEADKYVLTEVKTVDGYTLLKDPVEIVVNSTDRDVKASVTGTIGLDAEDRDAIVTAYNEGIRNEDGDLVTQATTDVGSAVVSGPVEESANGRTIGKTSMYVGDIDPATGTVDGKECKLLDSTTGDTSSRNASVKMAVLNQKGFNLPQTGGAGLYLITILGILAVFLGSSLGKKDKKRMG